MNVIGRCPITTLPAITSAGTALQPLEATAERARDYARGARAASTERAYRADWAHWAAWCEARGLAPLPTGPETVALYLADHAGKLAIATLGRRLVAIARGHRFKGHHVDLRNPVVRETWAGIRRAHGTAPRQKAAVLTSDLRAMLASLPVPESTGAPRLRALRDRAILLVGFASAMRRSELAALDVADLAFSAEGVSLRIRRSKTDQEGAGAEVGLPLGTGETCPVGALRAWLKAANIEAGPVFRPVGPDGRLSAGRLDSRSIAEAVKRAAARLGRDPRDFGGHSLRAGFATSAAAAGAQLVDIMEQTRHRSEAVARGYVRKGNIFRNRAARALGL